MANVGSFSKSSFIDLKIWLKSKLSTAAVDAELTFLGKVKYVFLSQDYSSDLRKQFSALNVHNVSTVVACLTEMCLC